MNGFSLKISVWACLFAVLTVSCRTVPSEHKKFEDGTSDVLYENSERFLLDKSLLSSRKGYENVIREGTHTSVFPAGLGIMGRSEKLYSAVWLIVNDSLFLVGLDRSSDRTKPFVGSLPSEAYDKMEKFLKTKFSDGDPSKKNMTDTIGSRGTVFASWVTGDYYRKKARTSVEDDLLQWAGLPFEKITFSNGIVTKRQTLETQPLTEKEMQEQDRKQKQLQRKLQKDLNAIKKR